MLTTSIVVAAMLLTAGGDSFPSGPPVGDKLPDFKAHAFSGGDAGKEFKLHEKIKGGPSLIVFVHEVTRPGLGQFLKPVDKYAAENGKLATQIVWLSGDKEKTEEQLKRIQNSLNYLSPITICLEGGKDGPATYGLNDKVQMTVLVAKDNKVVANFALTDPNAKDSTRVIAAVAKMLGKEAPKEEPKKEEKKKRPAAGGKSPELQMLMRKMINKDNDEDAVKRIADEMKKWAGNDEKKLTELREYCQMVAGLRYGTEAAQAALKKLGEK